MTQYLRMAYVRDIISQVIYGDAARLARSSIRTFKENEQIKCGSVTCYQMSLEENKYCMPSFNWHSTTDNEWMENWFYVIYIIVLIFLILFEILVNFFEAKMNADEKIFSPFYNFLTKKGMTCGKVFAISCFSGLRLTIVKNHGKH